MSNELSFLGYPKQFRKDIEIYPPKVKDVIANKFFGVYERMLTYSQEEVEDELMEAEKTMETYPTPLEYLLNNAYHNEQYRERAKEAFEFFTHQKVEFLYEVKTIVFGDINQVIKNMSKVSDLVLLTEEDFFDFQNEIRMACGKKTVDPPNPNEHPRIKEMKRKARYRDKMKAKQAAKGKGGISLFTMLVSICCMGIGITPLNIGEMSYVALDSILRKYQEKEKYQLDVDSLLAGADSKKINPKYWIRNFEE